MHVLAQLGLWLVAKVGPHAVYFGYELLTETGGHLTEYAVETQKQTGQNGGMSAESSPANKICA